MFKSPQMMKYILVLYSLFMIASNPLIKCIKFPLGDLQIDIIQMVMVDKCILIVHTSISCSLPNSCMLILNCNIKHVTVQFLTYIQTLLRVGIDYIKST
jgi:hypothetical protein